MQDKRDYCLFGKLTCQRYLEILTDAVGDQVGKDTHLASAREYLWWVKHRLDILVFFTKRYVSLTGCLSILGPIMSTFNIRMSWLVLVPPRLYTGLVVEQ